MIFNRKIILGTASLISASAAAIGVRLWIRPTLSLNIALTNLYNEEKAKKFKDSVEKSEEEKNFFKNWGDNELCPLYESKIKGVEVKVGSFLEVIEGVCKKEGNGYKNEDEKFISYKSIFYGLDGLVLSFNHYN